MEDRIIINVSGRKYETFAASLRRLPHSLLGDELRRAAYWDAARGEFFLDRSASSFEGVLLAYQTDSGPRRPSNVPEEVFAEDLRFYGIPEQHLVDDGRSVLPGPSPGGWRGKLSAVLQSASVTAASALVTVVSVVVFCLSTLPQFQWGDNDGLGHQPMLRYTELVCVVLLFVELIMGFITSSQPARFFLNLTNVIDLIATVLFLIGFVLVATSTFGLGYLPVAPWLIVISRLVRLLRVFRFVGRTAAGQTLKRSVVAAAPSIAVIFAVWLSAAVFFASLTFWLESSVRDTSFVSIPTAIYWAVTTMTTVGYGDMVPSTPAGVTVTSLCAYTGYTLAALPVAVLAAKFWQCSETSRPVVSSGVKKRGVGHQAVDSGPPSTDNGGAPVPGC